MMSDDERQALYGRLKAAAGKYSDYGRYFYQLMQLEEEYDETLELYNFDIWMGESGGTIREQAAEMLRITGGLFSDMKNNAGQELYYVMKEIMCLEEEEQIRICGASAGEEQFPEDKFEDMLAEWEDFCYTQNGALESFLEHWKTWAAASEAGEE